MLRRLRRRVVLKNRSRQAIYAAARLYRHTLLRRVAFIGVTGSSGKTMTKHLLGAILSTRLCGVVNPGDVNVSRSIARTILKRARPWHDFCVLEVGLPNGPMDRSVRLVAPHIAVVTTVGTEHISAFGSIDAIAAEKSKLVVSLPPDGTAVLNADDPRVLAMQARSTARILTYGLDPSANVRASDIEGRWPDRLSFTVVYAAESHRVQTQLCGEHWVSSVLAALTAALAMGVPLAHAVPTVVAVPPFPRRMSPVLSPDGVTFLCDDIKAPLWSTPLALHFVKHARAARKIVVMGTISDYLEDSEGRYRAIARQALEAADHVVFLGSNAMYVLRDARRSPDGALAAVPTVEAARKHLQRLLRPGDLVLIKGSRADRMASLVDTRIAPPGERGEARVLGAASKADAPPVHVIVGLGNPGERYTNTPHNAGQRALDLIAASLGASWTTQDEALLARVDHPGGACYLVKPITKMNLTGPALGRLAERLGVGAADLILLHDEIALPLGSVRTRMSGSDGGHRGVLSVLDAFETFDIRRVKIGVGRPQYDVTVKRHVVSALGPAELAVLDGACAEAATRAGQLAGVRPQRRAWPTASLTAPRTDTPDSSPS